MVHRKVKYMVVKDSAAAWCETAPYFLFSMAGTKEELKEEVHAKVVHQGHADLFLQDSEGDFAKWDEPIALPASGTIRVRVAIESHPAGNMCNDATEISLRYQLKPSHTAFKP